MSVASRADCADRASRADDSGPILSVLMPTLDESRWLEHSVRTVRASLGYGDIDGEVVVCDGGSSDGTAELAESLGAKTVRTDEPGRARQLNLAAERASGDILVLLHADSLVGPRWAQRILAAVGRGAVGGWCEIEILPENSSLLGVVGLKAIAEGIKWRTRLFRTATGDQSIFLTAEAFDTLGGVPERPVMEGAKLASRLRQFGPIEILDGPVRISGRRWERGGLIRTMLLMYAVRTGLSCGVDEQWLGEIWNGRT